MNTTKMHRGLVVATILIAFGMTTGCDQMEKAAGDSDLGVSAQITKLAGTFSKTLSGITDLASAKEALPALKDMNLDLDGLVKKVQDMSPESKGKITEVIGKAMPQVEDAIEQVSSINGVGTIVGPTLNSLKDKFKSLM